MERRERGGVRGRHGRKEGSLSITRPSLAAPVMDLSGGIWTSNFGTTEKNSEAVCRLWGHTLQNDPLGCPRFCQIGVHA